MTAIQANVEAAWVAKQAAEGSPAATAIKRGRKVGGDMNVAREQGSENYSDGQRFSSSEDFIDTISGNGNPILQGQPGVLAYLHYLMLGQETVTGAADPYEHVATPNSAGSFWTTWWKKVGTSPVLRQRFNDCKITSLRVEASSASKVVKITPTFISLDSGEVVASDPVKVEDVDQAFLFTEGEGRFEIDGTVFRGHSSVAYVISDAVTPWYGDTVTPHNVVYGQGTITIEGVTILVDQQGFEFYNSQVYGDPTPSAGTKPIHTLPALGSYELDLRRGTVGQVTAGDRQFKVEFPNVRWSPDLAIPGNPDGGPVELALGASTRKVGADPHIRVTSKVLDPAYT